MAPPKVYKNFINGEWVESVSGRTFENLNPANRNELIGIFQKSSTQDIDNAIAAAKSSGARLASWSSARKSSRSR